MKNLIKSLAFFLMFWVVTLYYFSKIFVYRLLAQVRGQEFSSYQAHMIASQWGKMILTTTPGWDIEIKGEENLPSTNKPFVIVANHESSIDILAIYYLKIQFRWLSKESMFKIPFVGRAMRWAGYVPIKRGRKESHLQALQESARWLERNVPMLFFPEGTRSISGRLGSFKTGAFRLAQEAGVPVLPIVLHGAGRLMKKKTICPHAATVRIEILPLIESLENESSVAFTERVRELMVERHTKMEALSQLERSQTQAEGGGGPYESELACGNRPRTF